MIVLVGIAGFTSWKVRKIHTETLTAEESTLEEGTETENLVLESAEKTLTSENAPEETETSTQETEAIDLREGLSGRFAEDNDDYRGSISRCCSTGADSFPTGMPTRVRVLPHSSSRTDMPLY